MPIAVPAPVAKPAGPVPAPTPAEIAASVRLAREEFTPGTPAEYKVTFENPSPDERTRFEVSTVFVGAAGAERDRTSWRRIEIAPGQRHPYAVLSTTTGVTGARLSIRLLKEQTP